MNTTGGNKKPSISDYRFIKEVTVGNVNPHALLSDQGREVQIALLNRCLNDHPKGSIIGRDITIGRFMMGEHELTMQKTTYHIGFLRKPSWLEDYEKNKGGEKIANQ
jgi:hypothetical protein